MIRPEMPWELAPRLPWHVFTSPAARWAEQPSFVIGEYLFYTCTVIAFVHAWRQGDQRRRHLVVALAALLAGTANDLFFMALPLVDNFWQAQATVMLTPRLPLYIPCVYTCFMYYSTVAAWRLNLPPRAHAALSGLAACVFYAPYDIVGAKFLWWTWHDSDLPISNRLLGAPVGSTMWVLTFVATFSYLLRRALDRDPAVTGRTAARAIALVCGLSSLLMIVQLTVLQQLDHGVPGPRGLVVELLLYGALVAAGWREARPEARGPDRILRGAVVAYFVTLTAIMAVFTPETHRSTSVHQTYGACHVPAIDIAGHTRYQFLCAADYDEDFSFDCAGGPPAEGSDWYTVCGRPHTSFARWMGGVLALSALGLALYSYLLGPKKRPTA
jgi:hypothetical protein